MRSDMVRLEGLNDRRESQADWMCSYGRHVYSIFVVVVSYPASPPALSLMLFQAKSISVWCSVSTLYRSSTISGPAHLMVETIRRDWTISWYFRLHCSHRR